MGTRFQGRHLLHLLVVHGMPRTYYDPRLLHLSVDSLSNQARRVYVCFLGASPRKNSLSSKSYSSHSARHIWIDDVAQCVVYISK